VINLDLRSSTPIYQQVVEQIKTAILRGTLDPGDRLPSVREMATTLTINPNTIQKAYQELERQGIIETVRGRGTFVAEEYRASGDPDAGELAAVCEHFRRGIVDAHYLGLSERDIRRLLDEQLHKVLNSGRDVSC